MALNPDDLPTCGVEYAAVLLHAHVSTVLELARGGKIPGRKVGRAWVFVKTDLIEYVRGECRSTNEATSGGSTSPLPTEESGYDDLLAKVKERVRNKSTTSSRPNSGNDAKVVTLSMERSKRGPGTKTSRTNTGSGSSSD